MPKISVVMPVLNGEKYLREAVESILNQSFKDFEFIIINDGSTDKTEGIIKSYDDPRIVYIKNKENLGLSKSYNIGIRSSKGKFIARMDADDVSLPERFEKQFDFLISGKADIVGSSVVLIDERGGRIKRQKRPVGHIEIKWHSLLSTPLIHPTVMGKAAVFKENLFDESYQNSEDYELWSRLLFTTPVRFANIPKPLLLYRVYPQSFTRSLKPEKKLHSAENSIKNIGRYVSLSEKEKSLIVKLRLGENLPLSELHEILKLYKRARREFRNKENFNPPLSPLVFSLIKYKLKQLI